MVDAAAGVSKDITLYTGAKMPAVGYGCWKIAGDVAAESVYTAIKNGYRLIDGAATYDNEV